MAIIKNEIRFETLKNHALNFDDNPKNVLDYCIIALGISEPIQKDLNILIDDINDENNEYFKHWDKKQIKQVSLLLNHIKKG